jgi:hypothetical protein
MFFVLCNLAVGCGPHSPTGQTEPRLALEQVVRSDAISIAENTLIPTLRRGDNPRLRSDDLLIEQTSAKAGPHGDLAYYRCIGRITGDDQQRIDSFEILFYFEGLQGGYYSASLNNQVVLTEPTSPAFQIEQRLLAQRDTPPDAKQPPAIAVLPNRRDWAAQAPPEPPSKEPDPDAEAKPEVEKPLSPEENARRAVKAYVRGLSVIDEQLQEAPTSERERMSQSLQAELVKEVCQDHRLAPQQLWAVLQRFGKEEIAAIDREESANPQEALKRQAKRELAVTIQRRRMRMYEGRIRQLASRNVLNAMLGKTIQQLESTRQTQNANTRQILNQMGIAY